ncbi:MAG: DNRLRE domain-containing protein [Anaerolineae bacterium]|nr:DNRLRE domain-containing protein [Anaerolineae bacterium]
MKRLRTFSGVLGLAFLLAGLTYGVISLEIPFLAPRAVEAAPAIPETAAPENLPEAEPVACSAVTSDGGTAFRSTLLATKDSYVTDKAGDTNYGTATNLNVGLSSLLGTYTYRTFAAFNLSSLPADAVILTATLELYRTSAGDFNIAAQALTQEWHETTVTWNAQPTATTANEATGAAAGDWYHWDVTQIVKNWYNGAWTNYGLRLVPSGMGTIPYSPHSFDSREAANPPRLVIMYVRRTELTVQADAGIFHRYPNNNYGTSQDMSVRDDRTGTGAHALLKFDLSGIPAGSTVISASVGLQAVFNRAQAGTVMETFSIAPEAVLATWQESGVTWNNAPATAGQGDPAQPWEGWPWNWFDVTHIAQAWSSGAVSNYGMMLKPASGSVGNALIYTREGSRPAHLIITYGPPPCHAATDVTINGAIAGLIGTAYDFTANVLPVTATLPITYVWEATGQAPYSGSQASRNYTWATPGTKGITVTVKNCESSLVGTHQVVITEPPPLCPQPLTGLTLIGPAEGVIETAYGYTATPVPVSATLPITYTWEATDQTSYTGSQATRQYTWATPGLKTITVSAQNCGGTVAQHYTVNVQPRPDLRITSVWYDQAEGRVYYIVQNTGAGTAPAGHTVRLFRDGSAVASTPFDEALPPGAVRAGSLAYAWTCAGATAPMRLCADATGLIPETNEGNNCFEESWSCDLMPPQITSGPTVSAITEHGATISWTTNEPCRGRLDYGRNGPFNVTSITDGAYKTSHQVILTGLEAASPYYYSVTVADAAGNPTNSGGAFFETAALGTDPVGLGAVGILPYDSAYYEFWTLYADVTGSVAGVDRVAFFLDGRLIGRDYAPTGNRYEVYVSPAALGLTRAQWFTSHTLQVQGYNLKNEPTARVETVTPATRPMPGQAVIVSPTAGKILYIDGPTAPAGATLDVQVAGEQYAWKCTATGFSEGEAVPPGLSAVLCNPVRDKVSSMKMYLDGTLLSTYIPTPGTYDHVFAVSLAGKSSGDHTLRFEARTSGGSTYTAESTIQLLQGQGELALGHRTERDGNFFRVTLAITNTGATTVLVDSLDDFARGFQVVEIPTTTHYALTSADWGNSPNRLIHIDFFSPADAKRMALAPGAAFALTYQLVPILYPASEHYYVGSGGDSPNQVATITYRLQYGATDHVTTLASGDNWVGTQFIDDAVREAFAQADMLLVTAPEGLRQYLIPPAWQQSAGKQRELNLLLSRMAELATLRHGVLAFLPISPDAATVDALLEPGGRWANALHPNFRTTHAGGYVLFVGEDEIIPVQNAGYGVPYSDLRYASTSGEAKPELVFSRQVGDDLVTLSQGLHHAILVARDGSGFDRQRALLSSGRGDGEGTFWTQLNEVNDRLDVAQATRLRWKNYTTAAKMLAVYQTEMAKGQSLVFYRGHGGSNSWNDTTGTGSVGFTANDVASFNFAGYHPFTFGLTCLSGDYKDAYSMAEAWLRYGAAAYIGAVSPSDRGTNGRAGRAFFNRWGDNSALSVGNAFTDMARDHWADDGNWREWIYQYHLYGDPKFGALPTSVVAATSPLANAGPRGATQLLLPDYTVTTDEEGFDHVALPGGSEWIWEGDPIVPTWKVVYDYPQGQRVQQVTLAARGGLIVATGLNIPTATLAQDCDCAPATSATNVTPEGWTPQFEQAYTWHVSENPDGTSTLELLLYPFTYNPGTTDVRFYQEWNFDIAVVDTTVDIASLMMSRSRYSLTEPIIARLAVENSGAEQSVLVQTVVKSLSDEVTQALTLEPLHAVAGASLLDLVVAPLPAGDYVLEVLLKDTAGHVLDSERTEFTAGIAAGEVISLSAARTLFKPGDAVPLTLVFQNTGDTPLNGVAVIRVETEDGVTSPATFTIPFTALAPGATETFNAVWNSTGATAETYRVVGYGSYHQGVSLPMEMRLSTRARVYLPLTLRQ